MTSPAAPSRRSTEAVADPAARWRRAAARLADWIVAWGLLFPLQITGVSFWVTRYDERVDPSPWGSWFLVFVTAAAIAGVIDVVFTSLSGQTPGKVLFGIRVETLDGGPVKFRHAVLRWIVLGPALALPPVAAVAVLVANALPSFFGSERRSIADRLAGTRVVSDREAAGRQRTESGTFVVHMGMEKWIAAVTGDVTVLPSRGRDDRQTSPGAPGDGETDAVAELPGSTGESTGSPRASA